MFTQIGLIAGYMMDLLEKRHGMLVFSDIHRELRQDRDLVLMSIGWLLYKNYVYILEDPASAAIQDERRNKPFASWASMSDLVIDHSVILASTNKRKKNIRDHLGVVAGKLLVLLEGAEGYSSLPLIENHLNEKRDIILMSLGWLIREGYVSGMLNDEHMMVFDLTRKTASVKVGAFSHV